MTIQINKPELEAIIRERLKSGDFRDVEDMLLHLLGGATPQERPKPPTAPTRRLEKELGVWVLHTGQPLSATVVDDTLNAIREERDSANLDSLR